jgi:hypothetical protein
MIKRLERLINIWLTYDLPVRTEASRKSTTRCTNTTAVLAAVKM